MEKVDRTNVVFFDRSLLNGGRAMDEILDREGFNAVHNESLRNALEITMTEKPSVVVIDMDEYGFSPRIRAQAA